MNSVAQSSFFDADCTVEQPSTNQRTVRIQRSVKRPDLANLWGKVMSEVMKGRSCADIVFYHHPMYELLS